MIYSQGGAPNIHDDKESGDDDSTIQSNEHNDDSWSNPPGMELFVKPIHWERIRNAITTTTCVAVTDGSYDPVSKLATACWIIKGRTSENRAKGAAQTPDAHDRMDANRAELHGIYCILYCIYNICNKLLITTGKLTIACDCDGAVR